MATKFSKKTYEMVQATLKRYSLQGLDAFQSSTLMKALIEDFVKQFTADNPRFDRDKFMKGL